MQLASKIIAGTKPAIRTELNSGRVQSCPKILRRMGVPNTLAYYDTVPTTSVKGFIVHDWGKQKKTI